MRRRRPDPAFLRPRRELVHITRPDVRGSRTEHGVKHHGATYRDDQVVEVGGILGIGGAKDQAGGNVARHRRATGAAFLQTLKTFIENPVTMLV